MIFELNEFHRNINSNELIEDLRHVAEFLNQDTVTIDDYNQHGRFHATTLTRRFGSWFNCLSRAGLKPSRSKNRDALCMSGGIADYDFGHWRKELRPGEYFRTAPACLTVCRQNVDSACQRLTQMWKKEDGQKELPVIFNEFCTYLGKAFRREYQPDLNGTGEPALPVFCH